MIDKNSLLYWYPKIENLDIPTPKTEIIKLNQEEIDAYANDKENFLGRLEKEVGMIIDSKFKLPVFIRTDQFSNKHFWKNSCYLDNKNNLKKNLTELVYGSKLAGMFGLPIEAICVREFISMDTKFHAFNGEMPVNSERRYFIRDEKVECHHPYWIEDSIKNPSITNWSEVAKNMNKEDTVEIKILTDYSKKVAEVLSGYWSVDFCKAKDRRWILIDMALGEESWHLSSCKYSTMLEEKSVEKPDFDSWVIAKKS